MPPPFHVDLRTVWRFRKAAQSDLDLTLLDLLDAIEQSGKLTAAARAALISHRHAWNLIEKWSEFSAPLVTIERGRGTQLSPLRRRGMTSYSFPCKHPSALLTTPVPVIQEKACADAPSSKPAQRHRCLARSPA